MVCDAMLLDDPGNEWSKKEKKRFEDWLQSTAKPAKIQRMRKTERERSGRETVVSCRQRGKRE